MLHFRILRDHRLLAAMQAAEAESSAAGTPHSFLDIVAAVLGHLPELLALLNNPAGLLAAILALLKPPAPTPPVPPAPPAPTPAASKAK